MKQFLNVLYRRILYKIPLKFLLILLAVFAVLIASVKAEGYVCTPYFVGGSPDYILDVRADILMWASYNNLETTRFCFTAITDGVQYSLNDSTRTILPKYNAVCFNKDEYGNYSHFYFKGDNNRETVYWSRFNGDCFSYTSLQCQTEYNLIPISSVDQNYCTTNNLCPTCQVCPSGSGSISTLYINDILHVGSPFIYMNIPEEIGRDYVYTQGGTNMFIDVEGYNVDYDKIEGIVNTQSYTPDEYDLNSIITNVIPLFVPGLVIILFIYFVFRLIKKIF